ncbi:MAG: NAD(P)H-dependent oxidoreductase [Deltaproteobacteria bacterium]|nr:NAD(P)H-dependent oxidoreductase [Deltaproteobacteria bacterium]MBW2254442.1 NAD(P)H-dependent oxidoreductase [Deltaproteobacteria bacterium]
MKNVLIINAHQVYEGFSNGRLNQTLVDVATTTLEELGCEVRMTHIEKGYDVAEEIENHEWADLVITQTPVNWFNTPWMHKKYVDEVFTTALGQGRIIKDDGRTRSDPSKQYGTGGLSQGKKYLLSATWNAPSEAFGDKTQLLFAGRTPDDALFNLPANYKFCGYEVLEGHHTQDVLKNPQVEASIEAYKQRLTALVRG